jgi:AraC-like DNA-binding protein
MSNLSQRSARHGAIDQEHGAGQGHSVRKTRLRREFVAGLPVRESESVQLGPGTAEYRSQRLSGSDLFALSYRVAPKLAIHTVPRNDWAVLLMSLNPRSGLVFNGRTARPFDIFLSTGPDGYMTTGEDRCNVAIAIRKTRLISTCSAVAGVGTEDVRLRDLLLPREQLVGQRLHQGLFGVAAESDGKRLSEGEFPLSEALENDLISLLAAQLVPAVCRAPETNPFRMNALGVVRAASAASKALPAPGLADLCEAAGVSQRWLHKCFMEVLGVSPYHYIRLARLSRARELLLEQERTPALVKRVALSVGYRLSGRFAAEYRSIYGENPSDTLQAPRKV